jgi:uncharacterized protein
MRILRTHISWALCPIVFLSLAACMGGASAPTRFYMLAPVTSVSDKPENVAENPMAWLIIDPVDLPRYLNRPQIVTREDGIEYRVDDFNQWLVPLTDNLTRVMHENLSGLLATNKIAVQTGTRHAAADIRATVKILQLDGKLGKNATLKADWTLNSSATGMTITRHSLFNELLIDESYQSFIKTQNRMIESLCRAIADAVPQVLEAKVNGTDKK